MTFRFRSYCNANGKCPVRDLVDKQRHQKFYPELIAGFRKLRDKKNHGNPLTEPIEDGLLEFRVDAVRILFCFRPSQLILLLHGVVKKRKKLPRTAIEQAKRNRSDYYMRRCTCDEDSVDEDF